MQQVAVSEEAALDVAHGKVLDEAAIGAAGSGPWSVVSSTGELLAVYQRHHAGLVKPAVVLVGTSTTPGDG
jgi:hypothetical protein